MRIFKAYIGMATLLTVGLSVASCHKIIDHSNPLCDYTVQLRYDYNQENTSTENQYSRYIKSAEEYIFDAEGVLCSMGTVSADPRTGAWVSEHDLPPGRYSIIVVGNRTAMSRTHDKGIEPQIGVTRRENLILTLKNEVRSRAERGYFDNTDRLYYGYRTFTIAENQISNIRVDMVHSHLDLSYTIRWKNNQAPANTNDFYIKLNNVPSEYNLMPEFVYTYNSVLYEKYDPEVHDEFRSTALTARHHIPQVYDDRNIVNHRQKAIMIGNEISGQTITYRLRNTGDDRTETTLSLWRGNSTRSGEPERLMKDIPLNDFLNRSGIDLDRALKQQYHIVLEIYGDRVTLELLVDVSDWEDGGIL